MYNVVKNEGYDCCAGLREDREGEGHMRNFLSHAFYKIIGRLCRLDMTDGAGDFRMMNRTMADSILELKDLYFPLYRTFLLFYAPASLSSVFTAPSLPPDYFLTATSWN